VLLYFLTKVTGELLPLTFKKECEFLHAVFQYGLITRWSTFVSFLYYLSNIYTPGITSGQIVGRGKKVYERNHSSVARHHLSIYGKSQYTFVRAITLRDEIRTPDFPNKEGCSSVLTYDTV
jgi:hypothetical protein